MLRRRAAQFATSFSSSLGIQKRFGSGKDKIVTADDAAYLIEDNATITVGGFVAQGAPEEVLQALGKRFEQTGSPQNLTLVFGGGPGDWDSKGINHLAIPGLIRRAVGSHYGQVPKLAKLAQTNAIEAYNLPLGSVSRMIRCAAAGQPGHITHVGFGTAVDPSNGGGKINDITKEDLVVEIEIEGQKYLLYKAIPIDAAIVRGTTADGDGNVTMERESLYADHMIQAMSARAGRGIVIAQVERIGAKGSLAPRSVRIPGTMVDSVVVAKPENHYMSYATQYDPAVTAEIRQPMKFGSSELDSRKVIARRAALELSPSQVINLGIGMPEGIADVCNEEHVLKYLELTTEPGIHGGVGLSGHNFGPAVNYDALLEMHSQFDFYNGGGLDAAFLGMAEVNAAGDVNVTRVGPKLTGPGGFIDISQSTKRVTMLGTLTAGGLETKCEDGKLVIVKEGKVKKFVPDLKETTFSGMIAKSRKQIIHYITERCVFALTKQGLELIEVAPGIDVQTQVLDQMEFKPLVSEQLRTMNPAIFKPELMKLKEMNFVFGWDERMMYDEKKNTVYINLSNAHISQPHQIDLLRNTITRFILNRSPDGKVHAVINYDGFDVSDSLAPQIKKLAEYLEKTFYLTVRRYTSRAFTRHKLQADIGIADARSYSLEEVSNKIRRHGFNQSLNSIENMFARSLQEDPCTEDPRRITKKGFETLLKRITLAEKKTVV